MIGLMMKDIYTVMKKAKYLLFIILVFTLIPEGNMYGYAIFYASIIPITTLSYDERSKWDKLAQMMPYSSWDIVLSKYLEGYLFVGVTLVCVASSRCIATLFSDSIILHQDIMFAALFTSGALIMQAVSLPLMYWKGVEKGRILSTFLIVICIMGISSLILGMQSGESRIFISGDSILPVVGITVAAALIINVLSILISGKIYHAVRD